MGARKAMSEFLHKVQIFCRTDYRLATAGIAQTARTASIHKTTRFSDHAPLTVDYEFKV